MSDDSLLLTFQSPGKKTRVYQPRVTSDNYLCSKSMTRVLISETPFVDVDAQRSALERDDVTVEVRQTPTEADVAEAAADADALVVDVHTPVPAAALEDADDLKLIARAGTGYDNIDVAAATERGITVTNAPNYCTNEVATQAFGLLLACRRRIPEADRDVRNGTWSWETDRPIRRVPGSTLGLVSFGAIARKLAEQVSGLGLDLLVYDPYVDEETVEEYGGSLVTFDELLEQSDALSVHPPLTSETRGMIGAEELARLPDHAIVVNVARGGIIDEEALYDALTEGEIAAAGLDVLETEPPGDTPLLGLDNIVLTPHAGWYSIEAREELNATVSRQIQQVFAGDQPVHAVDPDAWN